MSDRPDTYTGRLWVPGHPVPKGSMKCVGRHAKGSRAMLVPDERADPDNWKTMVPGRVLLARPELHDKKLAEPLELRAIFHLKRPAKPTYPEGPIGHGTGDLDKFTRMIGDLLADGAGAIKDDSCITRIVAEKRYAEPGQGEGADIELLPHRIIDVPAGKIPVEVSVGRRAAYHVGNAERVEDVPALLRRAADIYERQLAEQEAS